MKKTFFFIISALISLPLLSREISLDSMLNTSNRQVILPLQVNVGQYSCVNYKANKLSYPGDSTKFDILYNKFDSLSLFGKGRINIIHIGGSHVQADVFTNQLRTNFANLQESFVSNRGIIFPFTVAKTNNPRNFSITFEGSWSKNQNSRPPISNELGITGYSITSNDSNSSISFNLNPHLNTKWQYNKLTLLYSLENDKYEPYLVIFNDTIAGIKENDAIVYYLNRYESMGKIILDLSSKHNYYFTKHLKSDTSNKIIFKDVLPFTNDTYSTDSLNISLESDRGTSDSPPTDIINEEDSTITDIENDSTLTAYEISNSGKVINFTIYGLLPTTNFEGITIHSLGVNGASLRSWLRCSLFEEQLKYIQPDLVILNIGINDANVPSRDFSPEVFKQKYKELIKQIYANNPLCAIIFVTNNDCILRLGKKTRYTNPNSKAVQKAIYELAEEQNAAVWDLYEIMGGYGSSKIWQNYDLMNKDRIHFTINGYKLLGNLLYNSIIFDWLYKK